MALKDKILNTWKNETKLNKHQSVAVFEFLNDDKIDKSIPKQTKEYFGNKRSFRVFEDDKSVKTPVKKCPKLSSTSSVGPEKQNIITGCSNNETDESNEIEEEILDTTIFYDCEMPIDEDYAQTVFDDIINYIISSYVHGKAFENEEENEKFWAKVHPNHQAVILQNIDDVRECFIKYLNNACIFNDLNNSQLSSVMNELLAKINKVNKDLELETIKQII